MAAAIAKHLKDAIPQTSVSRIRIRAPLQGGFSTSLNLQALASKAKMATNRMIGRTKMLLPTLTQQPEEKGGNLLRSRGNRRADEPLSARVTNPTPREQAAAQLDKRRVQQSVRESYQPRRRPRPEELGARI